MRLTATALDLHTLALYLHRENDTDLERRIRRAIQGLEPDQEVTLSFSPLDFGASVLPGLEMFNLDFRGYRA